MPTLSFTREYFASKHAKRAAFVNEMLAPFIGPKIKNFLINFKFEEFMDVSLDEWVLFATSHHVEKLSLLLDGGFLYAPFAECKPYSLPRSPYLKKLVINLNYCDNSKFVHVLGLEDLLQVTGQLLGLDVGNVLEVTNCFSFTCLVFPSFVAGNIIHQWSMVKDALVQFETTLCLDPNPVEAQAALLAIMPTRRGEAKKAAECLRTALRDYNLKFGTILNDPDLVSLRALPEFKELLFRAIKGGDGAPDIWETVGNAGINIGGKL
ncbi:hypothetical protein J1N35_025795 [Gossypium stocksii]|uniref:Uncharacterized protein n=1 Tax=Gossypium stocksii TaxID=47602 RepID=A0A9D3V708_9ROSI|nr:hypothetical protein J1N35_025795 [Gossypium stocksii]